MSEGIFAPDNTFIFEERRPHLAKPFTKEAFCRIISYVVSKEKKRFHTTNQGRCKRQNVRIKAREDCELVFKNKGAGIF